MSVVNVSLQVNDLHIAILTLTIRSMTATTTMRAMPPATLFHLKLERAVKSRWDGSQNQLAEKLEISQPSLRQYFTGSTPKPSTTHLLCKLLKIDANWLFDDNDSRLDPPEVPASLHQVAPRALIRELQARYDRLTQRLNQVLDRCQNLPWERAAAWLLRQPKVVEMPQFVSISVQMFKEISLLGNEWEMIADHARPPRAVMDLLGTTDRSNPSEVRERLSAARDNRPGILAISSWACYFDAEFARASGGGDMGVDADSEFWNDRRAWLLAMVVCHESVSNDPIYDPIRARLRTMGYIDEAGNARDFGNARKPLGVFELPEPTGDTGGPSMPKAGPPSSASYHTFTDEPEPT